MSPPSLAMNKDEEDASSTATAELSPQQHAPLALRVLKGKDPF